MHYYYATRKDKNQNLLVTSYSKKDSAVSYGGEGAKISKGLFFLDENGNPSKEDTGMGEILRSKLEAEAVPGTKLEMDRFALYKQEDGRFVPTTHTFADYGGANSAMKKLVSHYGTLAVIEKTTPTNVEEDDTGIPEGMPF